MKEKFQKVKTIHHILPEFHKFLLEVEKNPHLDRIIPWRISRQQKGSSDLKFTISYTTPSGLKGIMSKGSSAQEIFFICPESFQEEVAEFLLTYRKNVYSLR